MVDVECDDAHPERFARTQGGVQQGDRIASAAAGNRNDGAIGHGFS
jgi:hypothetical protein